MTIEIITTKTCSHCTRAKSFFKERGVKYREIDAFSEEGAKKLALVNSKTVPTLLIDGRPIIGFNVNQISSMIGLG
ncbi:glutaredoxin family protein [Alicyclobacillus fastidiosus]|uniref:Glutaredoxin family protein n=1 Tax=Alicyclobacillus fastidiosus TaxID=392011 RepID=A0ABY6ZEV9_9BACL|nr:glutaredoxin domain-containing protein [Alicyclobacillus fastidiosus]WAH41260.1 glutaredoxin family protein [Alicyclobacillus fastidiosus]